MMRIRSAALASIVALALVVGIAACGDDDNGATPGPTPTTDSGPPVVPPGSNDGGADAGPCDFNAYVTGLIQNNTNATAVPTEDLGDNCVDTQTPFPDSFFQ